MKILIILFLKIFFLNLNKFYLLTLISNFYDFFNTNDIDELY